MLDVSKPFQEAVTFIADKVPVGSPFSSAEWSARHPEVRTKAFFSARVENVRFLERSQKLLDDFLTNAVEDYTNDDGVTTKRIKVGSRADFVRQIREFQIKEGMASERDFKGPQEDITDITKLSRLQLIFDTNIKQSFGYGRWLQGMNPVVLDAYPASRFVRLPGSVEKRIRHVESEGEVRLKTDQAYWAEYQNAEEIGGFGVMWPPYGFNSNMTQRDVTRKEAERLGLLKKGERVIDVPITDLQQVPQPAAATTSLTDRVRANLSDVDPAIVEQYKISIAPEPLVRVVPLQKKPNEPIKKGETSVIDSTVIPMIDFRGGLFVFFLDGWHRISGDPQDGDDELNEFTNERTMLEEIKEAFGDLVGFV